MNIKREKAKINQCCVIHGRKVTEKCTTALNTCIDCHASCNGTVCDCVDGYYWNGTHCVGSELCEECSYSPDSCAPDLVCGADSGRCECPPNLPIQYDGDCYGRKVTEKCTTALNTCIDCHASCNGTVCDCDDGYYWNGTHCVGSELCEECSYSPDSCAPDLVCGADSGRCECPPNLPIQYDGDCYGRKVTEKCTTALNTCIDCHASCNGTVCDCDDGYYWNGTHCVGSELCEECSYSPDSCAPDLVCGADSGRCECPPNLPIQYDGDCYGRKVTEKCTTALNTCIDCHASCNGTVCDCDDGYYWNGTHCVGSELCEECSYSPDSCAPDLVCGADSGRCECPPNLPIQYDGDCYGRKVTEKCTTALNTCIDCHASCNGTVCDCDDGYYWNGTHCVGSELCEECSYSPDSCAPDLVCGADSGRCECPPNLPIQYDGDCYGRKVTEKCTTALNTCIDCHASCNGTVCDCDDGYYWNGTHCVGSELCEECSYSPDSCAPDLVCGADSGRCECPPNLPIQYDGDCYGRKVTEKCTTALNTCIDCHASCNGTVCDCDDGYYWNGTHCVGSELCEECSYSPDSCAPDLVCGADSGRCECPPDLPIQYDGDCYGRRVTEKCTTALNTCIDCHASCNGTVCDCDDGYYWNGTHCVGSELCEECSYSPDSCAPDLVCGADSGRCECPPNLPIQYDGDCYGRKVTEKCTTALNTCIDCHASCNGTVCDCDDGYYWNGTHCVGSELCEECSYSPDSCAPDLVCGADSGRCECPPNLPIQYDGDCYGRRVTEKCTTALNTCIDCHASCNGTVCDCDDGYYWNGTLCVGQLIDEICDNSPNSCSANGLVCGDTWRCECPPNEVQINNLCFSLLCESCTVDGDCLGKYQLCIDNICQCDNTTYYTDSCGLCKLKVTDYSDCSCDEECLSNTCLCDLCVPENTDDCCDDCTSTIADIIFVTDASGSVGSSNYQTLKAFVITLVNEFTIGTDDTRVGIVDYATGINEGNTFNLDTAAYDNNLEITEEVCGFPYSGGFTRTDLALDRALAYFTSAQDRPLIPDFAIVFTDGVTNNGGEDELENSVQALKDEGVTIFVVGIGSGIELTELQLIASSDEYVFQATFDALNTITDELLTIICSLGG
ncbi:cell death abnormality protein 1-like [Ruditapes philippinarum]|uniref:cell death abnormality protein 1-like n=1 Tax=Ruditapes philippinarum TaxID=129788 RepID=UPI00295BA401|nr:cell death abnormality protein 1-like [Ruditapes philippinarum]